MTAARRICFTLLFSCIFWLTACTSLTIDDAETTSQTFAIEDFLRGDTVATGILFDRSGNATRHFNVDLEGTWDEKNELLTLREDFVFNDGEENQRVWKIKRLGDGKYEGEADDVSGKAIGVSKGNTMLWKYELNIPYKGSTLAVDFEDWMFLNDDILINRAVMRKFGFKVGEVLITIKPK